MHLNKGKRAIGQELERGKKLDDGRVSVYMLTVAYMCGRGNGSERKFWGRESRVLLEHVKSEKPLSCSIPLYSVTLCLHCDFRIYPTLKKFAACSLVFSARDCKLPESRGCNI